MSDVPPGYKQTEVGVIPEDWDVTSVGHEFEVQLGKMLDSTKNSGTPKPYIGNRHVQWGKIESDDLPCIAISRNETLRYQLKKGDLLVCEGGEVGRAALWEGQIDECYYQKALHRLRPKNDYFPGLMLEFLSYWAKTRVFSNYVTQTSIAHLPAEKLRLIPLPDIPVSEQRAIASALADMDALLASMEELLIKKRHLKQGAMQELLTGKKRLEGFQGEWKEVRLGDICQIKMGRTPSRLNSRFWGEGFKWISISDLNQRVVTNTKEQITTLAAAEMDFIPKGTLIMSFKLSIGRLAFAGENMYSNEAICSFNRLQAESEYLYYALHRIKFEDYGKQAVKGYTLNKESIQSIVLWMPSLLEQQAITAILSDMDAEIDTLEERLAKTRDLKQGMMQELLTGRTRLV